MENQKLIENERELNKKIGLARDVHKRYVEDRRKINKTEEEINEKVSLVNNMQRRYAQELRSNGRQLIDFLAGVSLGAVIILGLNTWVFWAGITIFAIMCLCSILQIYGAGSMLIKIDIWHCKLRDLKERLNKLKESL